MSFKEYAEIVAHRLCVYPWIAENALKTLDEDPRKAFKKLARMGTSRAADYVFKVREHDSKGGI